MGIRGLGSGDWEGSEARSFKHTSNLRGLGMRSGYPGSREWDPWTGIWVSGSGYPGTGNWGLGRLGGQILETCCMGSGPGIGIRVSGDPGDWDLGTRGLGSGCPGTGIWGSGIGMRGSGDWAGLGGQILDTFVDSGGSEARSSRHSSNLGAGAEAQELRLRGCREGDGRVLGLP